MKVYLQPPQPSLGLERIVTALRRYAPATIEVCEFPRNVDLTVIYAIGRRDHIQRQVDDIRQRGKQYAIIQVCLRSTLQPHTDAWKDIWQGARVVWSYYDLPKAIRDDGGSWNLPYYYAPLGVDASVFYPRSLTPDGWKDFTIVTSGMSRLSESVRECFYAAMQVDGITAHIGGRVRNCTSCYLNQTDEQLAWLYSQCKFASGLRRTEGFELPAIEGLLCGARPIVFDTHDYHLNYGPHAEYIHEGARAEVVDQLVELFRAGPRPVTEDELAQARQRYDWATIISGFWERVA